MSGGSGADARYNAVALAALVVFIALLFWFGVFAAYFTAQGTSLLEFLLGRYEALPIDLGEWRVSPEEAPINPAWLREQRFLLAEGRPNPGSLILQVRYRDRSTLEIVHSEPERRVSRRRVKAP